MNGYPMVGGAVAALTLGASVGLNVHQAEAIHGFEACQASIGPKARADADPGKLCAPIVAERWARAVRAQACDDALAAKPENRYGVGASCSAPVKALQAQRDAAQAERDGALSDLTNLRTGQAAAIRRAQSDAQVQAERKARAAVALQNAPRTPDGLVVCDAGCLRLRSAPPAR